MSAKVDDRALKLTMVGGTLLVTGLLFGLLPVSTTTRGKDVSCGNAWFLSYDKTQAGADRIYDAMTGGPGESTGQEQCVESAGSRGTIGFVLGGLGGLALIGAMLVGSPRKEEA